MLCCILGLHTYRYSRFRQGYIQNSLSPKWHDIIQANNRIKTKTKDKDILVMRIDVHVQISQLWPLSHQRYPDRTRNPTKNLPRSGSKRTPPITTKSRTRHDSVTVATCAKPPHDVIFFTKQSKTKKQNKTKNRKEKLYDFFITRGQFWPSGIVVACVCVCVYVCVSVCPSIMSLSER